MSESITSPQKISGPIVSGIVNILILCPVHYLVATLSSGIGAATTTIATGTATGSEAATTATAGFGVIMIYVCTWGGSGLILLGALASIVGAIASLSGNWKLMHIMGTVARVMGMLTLLIALYLFVTCGVMMISHTIWGLFGCVPTLIAALVLMGAGKKLRKASGR